MAVAVPTGAYAMGLLPLTETIKRFDVYAFRRLSRVLPKQVSTTECVLIVRRPPLESRAAFGHALNVNDAPDNVADAGLRNGAA